MFTEKLYPTDLQANRNGDSVKEVNYLDVKIVSVDCKVETNVYSEINSFDFCVTSLALADSNIPF